MKHYLIKLIETPEIEDPVKNALDVHKHFTRYSKGQFDGPLAKISKTAAKLTIGVSYEYEDELLRIMYDLTEQDPFEVAGAVISSGNFTALAEDIGLGSQWKAEKSKGKSINYNCTIKADKISREQFRILGFEWPKYAYVLLNITSSDGTLVLKTKKKPPRPSSKNPEDDNTPVSRLQFSVLKIPNTPENLKRILNGFLSAEEIDELPVKWKSILISNTYEISGLIMPSADSVKNSGEMRKKTLRKGTLKRAIEIDQKPIIKNYDFTA